MLSTFVALFMVVSQIDCAVINSNVSRFSISIQRDESGKKACDKLITKFLPLALEHFESMKESLGLFEIRMTVILMISKQHYSKLRLKMQRIIVAI